MYGIYLYMVGDAGGKVNVLGDDSIGHCEKKNFIRTGVLILNGYRDSAV
jgi:hypothetical protein